MKERDDEYSPTFADSMDTEVTKMRERYSRLRREQMRFDAAVAAMQGIISDKSDCTDQKDLEMFMPKNVAVAAVAYADALIKELEKK